MAVKVSKLTVKKPASKKVAAKKPVAKATVVKKSAAKKVTAKKTSAKKTAVQKVAAKTPAVKKTTVKKPEQIRVRPALEETPIKSLNLFDALAQNSLPKEKGYIVSSFLQARSSYYILEVISFTGIQTIKRVETGLVFQANGKKLHILIEPSNYPLKAIEPAHRNENELIPKRFSELEIVTAKNQTRIMVAKEPAEIFASFTVLKPAAGNFSVFFFNAPEILGNLSNFFENVFTQQMNIHLSDAKLASRLIANTVEKTMPL
jgi:hypothetical protein